MHRSNPAPKTINKQELLGGEPSNWREEKVEDTRIVHGETGSGRQEVRRNASNGQPLPMSVISLGEMACQTDNPVS